MPNYNHLILFLIALVALINTASSAYCNGSPEEGERVNQNPIFEGELEFVRSVKNAKLYLAGPSNARFQVLHVYGTPYEAGLAQGQILKEDIRSFISKTWEYLVSMAVEEMGDKLSPLAQAMLVNFGFKRALDWSASVTAPFTSQRFYDELKGLADGSGVDYDMLLQINMFPELTKASCSFFGSWNTASVNQKTYQLRALDYDTVGPFKDHPLITVYHPPAGDGHAWAQNGWPATVGALTGISSKQMSISEIGVSYPDDSFGQGTENTPPEKVKGNPWMNILRDVLQYANSLEEGVSRIQGENRTCNLIIGLGDGKSSMVNGIQYSGYVANPYNDVTLLPEDESWHPHIQDVVYNGMDWLCPTYTSILGGQLQKYHGKIDEKVTIQNILPTVQTGNLHIAISDLTDLNWYLGFARASNADPSEPEFAYERQFTKLDMKALFNEPPPN